MVKNNILNNHMVNDNIVNNHMMNDLMNNHIVLNIFISRGCISLKRNYDNYVVIFLIYKYN